MDNRALLKQARKAIDFQIAQSPDAVTVDRVPMIPDGFGGLMPDPEGAISTVSIRARVSHERRGPLGVETTPTGLDTALSLWLLWPHDVSLREGETIATRGRKFRLGPPDALTKFGGVQAYQAPLYPSGDVPSGAVEGVSLNGSNPVALDVGDEFQLVPTIYPEGAINRAVTWASSGPVSRQFIDSPDFDIPAKWALGAGAQVRPQGWVCKLNSGDAMTWGTSTFPVTPSQRVDLFAVVAMATMSATKIQVYCEAQTSSGVVLGYAGLAEFVAASDGTSFVSKSAMMAPGTYPTISKARIVILPVGYVSGQSRLGYIGAFVDGVSIVTNPDFADGATGWGSVLDETFTLDPTTAYLGNSYDGTARNTLALTRGATASSLPFSVIPGLPIAFSAIAKGLSTSQPMTAKVRFRDGSGGTVSESPISFPATDTAWTTRSSTITPVDSGIVDAIAIFEAGASENGAWLVGRSEVNRTALVVSVDYDGTVEAISDGSATVTATTVDGGFTATRTFEVTV